MMQRRWLLLIIVIGLGSMALLAGCAVAPVEDSVPVSGPLDANELSLPEGAVLSYQRSGGFAGEDQTWLIYADGKVQNPDGEIHEGDPAQVSTLLQDLEGAGFFQLDPGYQPENECCDRFVYVLTARYGELANQMTAIDGVESVPASLWESLDLVQSFIVAVPK